jgi:hypothetical protein
MAYPYDSRLVPSGFASAHAGTHASEALNVERRSQQIGQAGNGD